MLQDIRLINKSQLPSYKLEINKRNLKLKTEKKKKSLPFTLIPPNEILRHDLTKYVKKYIRKTTISDEKY
jgi:ribosome recycling factor